MEIKRSSHMFWSNVYNFHNCVPVWLIKIMAELLKMELSLDESHTFMLFVELKIACQTAFGELTEPQVLKNIKPPAHQQMSVLICDLDTRRSTFFGTHDIDNEITCALIILMCGSKIK